LIEYFICFLCNIWLIDPNKDGNNNNNNKSRLWLDNGWRSNYKTSFILNGWKLICHSHLGIAIFPQTTPFLLPHALNACYAGYSAGSHFTLRACSQARPKSDEVIRRWLWESLAWSRILFNMTDWSALSWACNNYCLFYFNVLRFFGEFLYYWPCIQCVVIHSVSLINWVVC
jgi:hypothetical protein